MPPVEGLDGVVGHLLQPHRPGGPVLAAQPEHQPAVGGRRSTTSPGRSREVKSRRRLGGDLRRGLGVRREVVVGCGPGGVDHGDDPAAQRGGPGRQGHRRPCRRDRDGRLVSRKLSRDTKRSLSSSGKPAAGPGRQSGAHCVRRGTGGAGGGRAGVVPSPSTVGVPVRRAATSGTPCVDPSREGRHRRRVGHDLSAPRVSFGVPHPWRTFVSFVPVTGPASSEAAEPARDSVVVFTDDHRTVALPIRAALPVLSRRAPARRRPPHRRAARRCGAAGGADGRGRQDRARPPPAELADRRRSTARPGPAREAGRGPGAGPGRGPRRPGARGAGRRRRRDAALRVGGGLGRRTP